MIDDFSNLTIKDIKNILHDITEKADPRLEMLSEDPRKGVQKELIRKQKTFEKEQAADDHREEMLTYERSLWHSGYDFVAGVDEVGRGPLAGPVIAGAVILPRDFSVNGITDSKQLSQEKRERFYDVIQQEALAVSFGEVSPKEIDEMNILEATKLAMKKAVEGLRILPQYVLVDAEHIPIEISQEAIIKGDAVSYSIAAASIMAKVKRDRLMEKYAYEYPGYGFESNVGYGTKEHLSGLEKLGATPIHRLSFAPVKKTLN